jgi:hypothetical protein
VVGSFRSIRKGGRQTLDKLVGSNFSRSQSNLSSLLLQAYLEAAKAQIIYLTKAGVEI